MRKGGYRPDGRLETIKDEILIEVLEGANHPSVDVNRRTFLEIARLGRKYLEVLAHSNGRQPRPPLGFAGA